VRPYLGVQVLPAASYRPHGVWWPRAGWGPGWAQTGASLIRAVFDNGCGASRSSVVGIDQSLLGADHRRRSRFVRDVFRDLALAEHLDGAVGGFGTAAFCAGTAGPRSWRRRYRRCRAAPGFAGRCASTRSRRYRGNGLPRSAPGAVRTGPSITNVSRLPRLAAQSIRAVSSAAKAPVFDDRAVIVEGDRAMGVRVGVDADDHSTTRVTGQCSSLLPPARPGRGQWMLAGRVDGTVTRPVRSGS